MNEHKTFFVFLCPATGAQISGLFDHLTGRLDLAVNECRDNLDPEQWRAALAFCEEHEGNYFYLRDVVDALRNAGVTEIVEM